MANIIRSNCTIEEMKMKINSNKAAMAKANNPNPPQIQEVPLSSQTANKNEVSNITSSQKTNGKT